MLAYIHPSILGSNKNYYIFLYKTNNSYYYQGYIDGFDQAYDSVNIEYTYHDHKKGDGHVVSYKDTPIYTLDNPGGCYRTNGHSHNKTGTCSRYTGASTMTSISYEEYDNYVACQFQCSRCGTIQRYEASSWSSLPDVRSTYCSNGCSTVYTCGSPTNTWKLGCDRKTIEEAGEEGATIESATLFFK